MNTRQEQAIELLNRNKEEALIKAIRDLTRQIEGYNATCITLTDQVEWLSSINISDITIQTINANIITFSYINSDGKSSMYTIERYL